MRKVHIKKWSLSGHRTHTFVFGQRTLAMSKFTKELRLHISRVDADGALAQRELANERRKIATN